MDLHSLLTTEDTMDVHNEANYCNKEQLCFIARLSFFFSISHNNSFFMIIVTAADTHHYLIVSCHTDTNDKLYQYTYGVMELV